MEKVVTVMGFVMKKEEVVLMVLWNDNGDGVLKEREKKEIVRVGWLAGQGRGPVVAATG